LLEFPNNKHALQDIIYGLCKDGFLQEIDNVHEANECFIKLVT